jgi:hypothetical protein
VVRFSYFCVFCRRWRQFFRKRNSPFTFGILRQETALGEWVDQLSLSSVYHAPHVSFKAA